MFPPTVLTVIDGELFVVKDESPPNAKLPNARLLTMIKPEPTYKNRTFTVEEDESKYPYAIHYFFNGNPNWDYFQTYEEAEAKYNELDGRATLSLRLKLPAKKRM